MLHFIKKKKNFESVRPWYEKESDLIIIHNLEAAVRKQLASNN